MIQTWRDWVDNFISSQSKVYSADANLVSRLHYNKVQNVEKENCIYPIRLVLNITSTVLLKASSLQWSALSLTLKNAGKGSTSVFLLALYRIWLVHIPPIKYAEFWEVLQKLIINLIFVCIWFFKTFFILTSLVFLLGLVNLICKQKFPNAEWHHAA